MSAPADLIVFCHLRWDFVWQRPQHLLTRLALGRRVFFIEEPLPAAGEAAHWEIREPAPNVILCRPRTACAVPGFHGDQMPELLRLLPRLLKDQNVGGHDAWFYTPMAVPLLDALSPRVVVYDCMDELSAFRGAPPGLLDREVELLRRADVVFTGGPSLYRAKKDRHPDVHCFPSSVDAAHFRRALGRPAEPALQAALPRPRLGFFGVIDERFDAPLIDAVAAARPDWQFTLVGPVVKIDPAMLPRRPNLHYFGQQPYEELPAFLAGWDVCLLPFARNESTRFISPTKTLEYMAAEKPIVSTPIADVAEPYGDIVYLGATPGEFVAGCEQALSQSQDERQARLERMHRVLARTSWDSTAAAVSELIEKAANRVGRKNGRGQNRAGQVHEPAAGACAPVVVIGAGPTGLSAAYHLGEKALLLERNGRVGGWCRSVEAGGFTFDFAGHIMFSNDPYVHEMYRELLGDNVHWQDREAWIFSKGVYTRYPFQGALYGLPPQVIKECILGAIEARFGTPGAKPTCAGGTNGQNRRNGQNGHFSNGNGTAKHLSDCCADGILESTARLGHANGNGPGCEQRGRAENFEEFIYRVWGAGIAKHFAVPYNRKLWAVPLSEMETSWLGGRVPLPDLGEMIEGALSPVAKPMGPNARFGYPLRGGFQALMDGFLPHLKGQLRLNAAVAGVSPARHTVRLADGEEISFEQLISTMPLPVLVRMLGDEAPPGVREAAAGLRYVSVRCVHLGIGRENLTEKHWIYYPEDTVFHRIFVQGNASPHCNPPGGFGLTCEITYHPEYKPLPCDGDALIERCVEDCRRVGFFGPDDAVRLALQVDLPHAYVVYDHARLENVKVIRDWLAERDILLAGRYSEWEYYNSDHAFLAGKKAAEKAQERLRGGAVKAGA